LVPEKWYANQITEPALRGTTAQDDSMARPRMPISQLDVSATNARQYGFEELLE